MPRSACALRIVLLAVAFASLSASAPPAGSAASLSYDLFRIAREDLRSPVLVPTRFPGVLDSFQAFAFTRTAGQTWHWSLEHCCGDSGGIDGIIAFERLRFRTLERARRFHARQGDDVRATRVRGHPAYVVSFPGIPGQSLVWAEGGATYRLGTGTPRLVPPRVLRALSATLQPLIAAYYHEVLGPDGIPKLTVYAYVTPGTITLDLSWHAECVRSDGTVPPGGFGGEGYVQLVPLSNGAFAIENVLPADPRATPWSNSVSGTVASDSVRISFRAAIAILDDSCDTGQIELALVTPLRTAFG